MALSLNQLLQHLQSAAAWLLQPMSERYAWEETAAKSFAARLLNQLLVHCEAWIAETIAESVADTVAGEICIGRQLHHQHHNFCLKLPFTTLRLLLVCMMPESWAYIFRVYGVGMAAAQAPQQAKQREKLSICQ